VNDLKQIGAIAKQTRKALGHKNMVVVAQQLGISKNDISEIERGIFRGSVLNVIKYLSFLGLELTASPRNKPPLEDLEAMFDDEY